MNDICLYGAERFVSDHDEDLLLFLQVDEVTKPGLLSQPTERRQIEIKVMTTQHYHAVIHKTDQLYLLTGRA